MTPSAIVFDRERPCPCRDETILLIAPADGGLSLQFMSIAM